MDGIKLRVDGGLVAERKAKQAAKDAESWAVGTRDGAPVPSTDPAYQNHSKYWAGQAHQSAEDARQAAEDTGQEIHGLRHELEDAIEEFAVPTQEAVDNWLDAHPEAATSPLGYITPEQFGAVGDGVADDSAALNNAINYARSHGFPVIKAKRGAVYGVASPVVMNGEKVQVIIDFNDATIKAIDEIEEVIKIDTASYKWNRMCNVYIDCAGLAEYGIYCKYVSTFHFSHIKIVDFTNTAFYIKQGNCVIHDMYIDWTLSTLGASPIGIQNDGTDSKIHNVTMRNCKIGVYNRGGLTFYQNVHPWLSNGDIMHGSVAFWLNARTSLVSCYADTYETAIRLDGGRGTSLTDFYVYINRNFYTAGVMGDVVPKVFELMSTAQSEPVYPAAVAPLIICGMFLSMRLPDGFTDVAHFSNVDPKAFMLAMKNRDGLSTISYPLGTISGVPKSMARPEEYGAVGDGVADDTEAVRAAVNTGYCKGTAGATYKITSTIDISDAKIDFNGASIVLGCKNGFATRGTEKADTTLSADVSEGHIFTLTDASSVESGDLLVLTDADHQWHVERDYYKNGGVFIVGEVKNNLVGVSPCIEWTHYAGTTVKVVKPTTCEITGLAGVKTINSKGLLEIAINLFETVGAYVHDCTMTSDAYITFGTSWSVGAKFDRVNLTNSSNMRGHENIYGIAIGPGSFNSVSNCVMASPWNCVTITGGQNFNGGGIVGATPVQYTKIDNCVFELTEPHAAYGTGYGDHSNSYKTTITRTTMAGAVLRAGVTMRDCNVTTRMSSSGVPYERMLSIGGMSLPDLKPPTVIENVNLYGTICLAREDSRYLPDGYYDSYFGDIILRNVTGKTKISGTVKDSGIENRSTGIYVDSITIDGGTLTNSFVVKENNKIGVLTIKNKYLIGESPDFPYIVGNIDHVVLDNITMIATGTFDGSRNSFGLKATGADYRITGLTMAYVSSYDVRNTSYRLLLKSGKVMISDTNLHGCVLSKSTEASEEPLTLMVANSIMDLHMSLTEDNATWHTVNAFKADGTALPNSSTS